MKKLTVLLLMAILMIAVSINASAAPPDHAKGKPTLKFNWVDVVGGPIQDTFDFVDCGSFLTEMTVEFSGFWITHYDKNGDPKWEFYHSAYPAKIVNKNDDSYFVEGIPGQRLNRHWLDEPFNSDFIETGVQLMITLPGYGIIHRDVGRVMINWNGGAPYPEFYTGNWDSFDGDFLALCEVLTPAP